MSNASNMEILRTDADARLFGRKLRKVFDPADT